ncbi:MAG TPA: TlpA disulfide reductase family protein [Usitatibacter sp.]|nr:TlpA disulfide reductase family protein [Usitatibacter sp.]
MGEPLAQRHLARLDGRGELALPAGDGPVVVNVWATWCEPCRREMQSLERLHRLAPAGVRVVGISVDEDRNLAEEFLRQQHVTFANGVDSAAGLAHGPWHVTRFPTTLVVDARGVVRLREERARDWSDDVNVARVKAALGGGA